MPPAPTAPPPNPWNHNIHYHRVILDAVPPHARTALDVGTGNGLLAADLHARLPDVTGIDVDAPVLASARITDPGVTWLLGDAMTYDFGRTFDVVASVATLHHLPDLPAALNRLAELTAPGGVLAVVGLARDSSLTDRTLGLVGVAQHRWFASSRTFWEHSAPTLWPPPHSFREAREAAELVLPGARWRRHPMWRYSLVWRRL